METDRYLTTAEVVQITGRAYQTWANERFNGLGVPYYKVGRSIRYKLSDIISFMEKHRVDPEARLCSANVAGEGADQNGDHVGR